MWSQLNDGSVHWDFSKVKAVVLSALGLEKYAFAGAAGCSKLIVKVACLNCLPEEAAVHISL